MKNYDQIISRYFALMAEISELENLEYELVKTLLLKIVKHLEEGARQSSSSHDLLRMFDNVRSIQKNAAREQSAAVEGMVQVFVKKAVESSKDDQELKKLDIKITELLTRMDLQRETFRKAKDLFRQILQDLKKSDEAN